jgi:hypothetical protein
MKVAPSCLQTLQAYGGRLLAQPASYDAFRLYAGREVTGTVDWGPTAGEGTRTGRAHPNRPRGTYRFEWREFSNESGVRMRCLLVPVEGVPGRPGPVDLLA